MDGRGDGRGDGRPPWPEFPMALVTEQTWDGALGAWEGYLREARRAGWHGPFPAMPATDIVVRYAEARRVLSDEGRFPPHFMGSFQQVAALNPNLGPDLHAALVEMDTWSLINLTGDRHRALRSLLGPAFSPRSVGRVRPFVRDLAVRLLDELTPGECFMAGFGRRIPPVTLCELVGVPEDDRDRWTEWMVACAVLLSPITLLTMSPDQATAAVEARESLIRHSMDLIEARRADPRDDLASLLAGAEGTDVDDRALGVNLAELLFGGIDSTQRSIGQMMMTLVERPDLWDAMAADPMLVEPVVEECLRYRPAITGPLRRAAAGAADAAPDLEDGRAMLIACHSVNQDEAVFDDGATFDPTRPNAREHLSFGYGPHFCIGATLARAELQECLRVLTAGITCPQVSGEVVIVNQGAAGPVELPLTFTRRPPAAGP